MFNIILKLLFVEAHLFIRDFRFVIYWGVSLIYIINLFFCHIVPKIGLRRELLGQEGIGSTPIHYSYGPNPLEYWAGWSHTLKRGRHSTLWFVTPPISMVQRTPDFIYLFLAFYIHPLEEPSLSQTCARRSSPIGHNHRPMTLLCLR